MTESDRRAILDAFRADRITLQQADQLISAVNKQVPEKPIQADKQGVRYTDLYTCPNCRRDFTGTGVADYCYHCGQRLDWREFDHLLFGK